MGDQLAGLNRQQRRAAAKIQRKHVKDTQPERLTELPRQSWPEEFNVIPEVHWPVQVWTSRKFCVQIFDARIKNFPGMIRMSVNRNKFPHAGQWDDGITWDELNAIKEQIGYRDWWGVEVYPMSHQIVNVANMRHIWLMPVPLPIGFEYEAK